MKPFKFLHSPNSSGRHLMNGGPNSSSPHSSGGAPSVVRSLTLPNSRKGTDLVIDKVVGKFFMCYLFHA